MIHSLEQLREETKDVRLSPTARHDIRARLVAEMHAETLRPAQSMIQRMKRAYSTPIVATALTLLVAVVGAGASVAEASQALPGDTLYPVKLAIENVRANLALSASSRAAINTERATTRLEEAETLLKHANLNNPTSVSLAQNFQTVANDAQNDIAAVRAQNSDKADDLEVQLQAAVHAHAQILSALSQPNTAQSQTSAEPLLTIVQHQDQASSATTDTAEAQVSDEPEPRAKAAAENRLQSATQALANASATTQTNQPSAPLSVAAKKIDEGKQALDNHAWGKAFKLFNQAERLAHETKIIDSVSAHLDVPLTNVLNDDDHATTDANVQNDSSLTVPTPSTVTTPQDSTPSSSRHGNRHGHKKSNEPLVPLDSNLNSDLNINIPSSLTK